MQFCGTPSLPSHSLCVTMDMLCCVLMFEFKKEAENMPFLDHIYHYKFSYSSSSSYPCVLINHDLTPCLILLN